ncbi:unnamed protein product [Hymenolepis diminuta]|uniref:Uncharacterized protein n=1 Tax=Hymenolepis diminuta TaxID=6216 RepID=A0A0R3SBV9_HYMDI|nr:unnamed protein product [Hymenolepis diminuta]VUZ55125.1 unnamed protein product [Hymenolepis diminuta]VUZ55126.1 unnamed protein product [Hymenolepis diminuta]
MSVNECPLLHIELLEPIQPVPLPGELETFPRITLNTDNIIHVEKRSRNFRRNATRSGARLSRFRTQPITYAEIAEIDECKKGCEESKDSPDKRPITITPATTGKRETVESPSTSKK